MQNLIKMDVEQPRERAKENAADKAIRRTLAYSAIFNYPVSEFQLYTYLVTKRVFEVDFFKKSLRRLVKKRHIRAKDGKYYLSSIRPVSWSLRNKYSQDLMKETYLPVKLLKSIPWIKMLAITGAVAANNAKKDDDIDIFIISEKNRLWLTRSFVILILKVVNKYAVGQENHKKFCCNLYIDESKLKWAAEQQNVYIAHEILKMHPLIDRHNTYLKFIQANDWALGYFKNINYELTTKHEGPTFNKSKFVDLLENWARKLQLKYMQKKKTKEITEKNFIHFNVYDHSEKILKDYKELLLTLEK